MPASNAFKNDIAQLLANNVNISNLGDATGLRGSVGAGSLFISLHINDPGLAGNQSTSEVAYTGYARVAVARGSWTVVGGVISNMADTVFGTSTLGTPTATHFGIGYESAGATKLVGSAALASPQVINIGGPVSFAAGTLLLTVT